MNNSMEILHRKNMKCGMAAAAMLVLLVVCLILFVGMGAMEIGAGKSLSILLGKLTGGVPQLLASGVKENEIAVVWDIRLPRVLCGIMVGTGLSVSGVIFQSLLRNPLADPYTLGVSTGAAFGASLAILASVTYGIMLSTAAFAFLFAFLTLLLVIFIAQRGGGMFASNLIISGIIVSAILSSGISFIKMMAGEEVSAIVFWLMGSLSSRRWSDVLLVTPFVLVGAVIAYVFANDLNVMTLGEREARTLGVNTKRIRLMYLILGSCITAACVAVSGVIGFIGLVVPHILRYWLTPDNRLLIPLSGLMGGLLLSVADNATRMMASSEIPVGVLTTLIGGPFFIYVFIRRQKK